jgi:hypothetical protein
MEFSKRTHYHTNKSSVQQLKVARQSLAVRERCALETVMHEVNILREKWV